MGSPRLMDVPGPFGELRTEHAAAWARAEAREWVEEVFRRQSTLYEAARDAAGERDILRGGRGPAFVRRSPEGDWVVRHAFRGGAVARVLEDRYLRLGVPRPFREAAASVEVRRRGIATPRVMAAAVYRDGPFYRGDVVTELVPGARTLGDLLFGDRRARDDAFRIRLLEAAARVPDRLSGTGIRHLDLNVDNLLIPGDSPGIGPILLDLDRCQLRRRPDPGWGRTMAARLQRSLRKGEERRGPPLGPGEWEAFRKLIGGR
jgi:3-deoxy-D-manno-octulosonic acid kinase